MPDPSAKEVFRRLKALGFSLSIENGSLVVHGPQHQMMPSLQVAISRNAKGLLLLAKGVTCSLAHNKPDLWVSKPDRHHRNNWYSAHCPICDRFMGSGPQNA
jgi:hypothetical protein